MFVSFTAQSSNILDGYYANGTILFSKNSYKHSKFSNPLQWNVKVSENQVNTNLYYILIAMFVIYFAFECYKF